MLTANEVLRILSAAPASTLVNGRPLAEALKHYGGMGMQWASGIERVDKKPDGSLRLVSAEHSFDIGMVSIRPDGNLIKMWHVRDGVRELIDTMPLALAKASPKHWVSFQAKARAFLDEKR